MNSRLASLGAVSAAIAVAAGAFGAHALRTRLDPSMLEVFETAARYQMYHAPGLLAAAALHDRRPSGVALASGWAFVVGTVCFSGSLYAMALTGIRALGIITPIGGAAFILGWLCLAVALSRGMKAAS